MKVKELMTRHVASCRVDAHLDVPAQLMWDKDVGCVAVVDHDGALAGVLTDRDITMACHFRNRGPMQIPVAEVMSKKLVVCGPSDNATHAARLMADNQVRRIFVIDGLGALVGVVTQNDLVREAVREHGEKKVEITEHYVLSMLNQVGSPHRSNLAATA